MDGVTAGADAAQKVVPLTNQYPLAAALLLVSGFAGFVIWLLFKYILKNNNEKLQASIENDVKIAGLLKTQADTIAAQTTELRALRESYVRLAVELAKALGKMGYNLDVSVAAELPTPTPVAAQPPRDGG